MHYCGENNESFDDKDAAEVETGDHGSKICQNLNDSGKGDIETDGFVVVELTVG